MSKFFGKTRIAVIDREVCIKEKCGYICMKVCPGVRMGDETVVVDKDGFPVISEELCTGCGICPKKCPVDCITIINLAEEMKNPIYQYGVNTFRLYGLPLPQKGVVGLIGKNGIGKSTAIKLMAGQLQPNFAEFESKLSHKDIMERLSPDIQNYFRSLSDNQLKVSLKPQNIYRIPEVFEGTTKELLEKNDERGAIKQAVEAFSLSEIMERKVGVLSGGELQRLAIAVAYCKDADLYYFDEPAAYLDVSQRLAASKALKELSGQKNVVVVEHDLAIFDYLSDYVHVLYGQENAYGVVSGVKGARSGINEYLQGYLREENVRFRNHEISFSVASATASRSKAVKFAYPALQKAYDSFSFSSKEGSIMEGEIIGMLGQNALGKSIFIKMIAGVEQPDNTSLAHLLRISYKPQYVKAEEGVEVQQMFSGPGLNMAFSESARRRLNVNSLMDKKLDSLSGGELQRVACALALSREADMYLFDEPSAFMDIEQRLEFSNLLQSLMSEGRKAAFVIDHDLLMLDSLSSRLITFDGKPASSGGASSPLDKREGMNSFLKTVGITLRRDKDSRRPRINKPDSALDREQKAAGEYYYYEN